MIALVALILAASPAIALRIYPRIPMSDIRGVAEVTLFLEVRDPGPDLYCPKVEWEVSGTRATHEEDCEPWEDLAEKPTRFSATRRVILGQGFHAVKVIVSRGKARKVAALDVEVR